MSDVKDLDRAGQRLARLHSQYHEARRAADDARRARNDAIVEYADAGLSQADIGKILGTSPQYVNRLLREWREQAAESAVES
jgi:CRP-like cAMP-binding protein